MKNEGEEGTEDCFLLFPLFALSLSFSRFYFSTLAKINFFFFPVFYFFVVFCMSWCVCVLVCE